MLDSELKLERSALVLVDMQKGFLKTDSPFARAGLIPSVDGDREELFSNAQSLFAAMRKAGRPVVYVNTAFRPDYADCFLSPPWKRCLSEEHFELTEGSESAAVIDELRPQEGDFIIVKKGHSAFQHTYLDRILSSLNVDTGVFAGNILGSMDETLRQGAALGYENILVTDASYPLRSPHPKSLVKRAFIVNTSETLSWIEGSKRSVSGEVAIRPCLIIVDVQNISIHPKGLNHRLGFTSVTDEEREEIVRNNLKLAGAMRAKGLPVIYIKSTRGRDALVDTASGLMERRLWKIPPGTEFRVDGTWDVEILDEIKPQSGDYVVYKRGHSAFGTTHLHRMLRNLGVNLLLISGGSVVGCVSDSTREGIGLGYREIVVADATYPPNKRAIGLPALASRTEVLSTENVLTKLAQGDW
ncbi:MAG: isochorismatase family cysteine hydrolase [Nitrososphaerales archaeon]